MGGDGSLVPEREPERETRAGPAGGGPAESLGAEVGKQTRVVPDGRVEINDPCPGPREVIRYAGAADSRGHRDAWRGPGMHDRFRGERRAAAPESVQSRMKIDTWSRVRKLTGCLAW